MVATTALCLLLVFHGRITHVPLKNKFKHENVRKTHGDTIKALILYHAADYFVYHGSVIGFQYDLLNQLGKDLHRPVVITIESDPEKAILECFAQHYDIVGIDFNKDMFVPDYIVESELR